MKRFIEMSIALLLLILCIIPFIIIAILIKIESKGPVIYWSKRIGKNELFFWMPKFRSMKLQTPEVATDILDSKKYLTNIGNLIRKLSIDELPQIFSVFVGDMSFVGPRPALFNQDDLIDASRDFSMIPVSEIMNSNEFPSIQKIFKTTEDCLYLILEQLVAAYPKLFNLTETAGQKNLYIKDKLNSIQFLDDHFTAGS